MNEITEEIKLTVNLMSSDIDDGAHGELQNHLYSLLEMKRNELQRRLVECKIEYVAQDPMPCKRDKPLTAEELMAGKWWCADTSEDCRIALESHGFKFFVGNWDGELEACFVSSREVDKISRGSETLATSRKLKQIHRIGNEFYWAEEIEID